MTWVAVGTTAIGGALSIFGGMSAAKKAKERASAERRRGEVEADRRMKDLFAEYDASIDQQRDALEKRDLAMKGETEMLRQAQLIRQSVDVDLSGGALDVQERAARRRSYFEDTP